MAAAAMLARRIRTSLLGNTTAAAQRIRNSAIGSSTAEGSRLLMAQDLLRRLPHKEETRRVFGLTQPAYVRLPHRPICSSSSSKNDLVDSWSLEKLEDRIVKLEAVCSFYKKILWILSGPIVVGILSVIHVAHGAAMLKERQKDTAENLSDLKRQIEYLEGSIN